LKQHLLTNLEALLKVPVADRLRQRYQKFRAHGHFFEKPAESVAGA
jgi:acetyl-CoA carboxylase alpha subunit